MYQFILSLFVFFGCGLTVRAEDPFVVLKTQNNIYYSPRGELRIVPESVRNFPPLLNAFRHEDTGNGFGLSEKVRADTRSIIDSLNRKLNASKISNKRDDIDKRVVEIREHEAELDQIVDLEIYEKCIDAARMIRFYEVGPINFAKELGASSNDLTVFKDRIVELNPRLLQRIGEIEKEFLRMLFSELDDDIARVLIELTTLECRRQPTMIPLLFGLSEFEKRLFSPQSLIEQPYSFVVDISITAKKSRPSSSDRIFALMLALGDAGMLKRPDIAEITGCSFDALTILRIEHEKEGRNLSLEMQAQATEKYNSSVKNATDEVQALFTTAEWKTISKYKFWYLIGCYGPSVMLFSDDAVTCLDLRLGKPHFAQLSERAKEVRPLVIKSCLEVQRAFIEDVFLKDNVNAELRKGFSWANSESLIGIPAIDLLYYYGSKM